MRLPIYQVDAFATEVFRGNPAAVVPLSTWLPDATLQAAIAGAPAFTSSSWSTIRCAP